MTYESSINESQIRDKVTSSDSTTTEPDDTTNIGTSSVEIDDCNNRLKEDASKVDELLEDQDDPICSTSSSLDHCDDLTVATDLLEVSQKEHEESGVQFDEIDEITNSSIQNRKLSLPNELHFKPKLNNNIEDNEVGDDDKEEKIVCYNKDLDDEIRNRLDKLNSLSDLINSLERQFDEANGVFREILKCSTDRLSSIAKTLGNKSIRQGRIYNAAKISVKQSQNDCQKACVQFEQANKDHQIAKRAIQEAEMKLLEVKKLNHETLETNTKNSITYEDSNLNFNRLYLNNIVDDTVDSSSRSYCSSPTKSCDTDRNITRSLTNISQLDSTNNINNNIENKLDEHEEVVSPTTDIIKNASLLSEQLNQAIQRLVEAEKRRGISEKQHLDMANKLMIAQEKLVKLEREHGQSIKRSLLYFEEARRFNDKLKTIKGNIDTITGNIIAAKRAYAQTLCELEQFSDDLHLNSMKSKVENNHKESI